MDLAIAIATQAKQEMDRENELPWFILIQSAFAPHRTGTDTELFAENVGQ